MAQFDLDATVFIVDDDEADRDSLTALLETCGLRVRAYGSARDFLDSFVPPRKGCLLLDLRLPEISGLELLGRMAKEGASLPVILVTAYGDVPTAVRAMKLGAIDFIEKPYTDEAILASVRAAIDMDLLSRRDESSAAEIEKLAARLTPREREVMDQLVLGRQNKEIAHILGISPRTVEIHRARVMEKMEARTLSHLVRMAITGGIDSGADG